MRTLWAVLLTVFLMHALTVYLLVFHKDRFCHYSQRVVSAIQGDTRNVAPFTFSNTAPLMVSSPKQFTELFGTITGVEASEAADESYSTFSK